MFAPSSAKCSSNWLHLVSGNRGPFLLISGEDGAFVPRHTRSLPCVCGQETDAFVFCGVSTKWISVILSSIRMHQTSITVMLVMVIITTGGR